MSGEDPDAVDARLLAEGDLRRLLARHYPALQERARLRMGAFEGDEAVQRAVLRLFEELSRGRRYRVPFRVVAHQVLGWAMREVWTERRPEEPLPHGLPAPEEDGAIGAVEARLSVEAAIETLPPRDAEVARLRYLRGLEIPEIADRLGLPRNAVDQSLHRGRAVLRRELLSGR